MDIVNKKRAVALGIRVGAIFLITVFIMIIMTYYVLSQNFHGLLTDYTIKLVEAMTGQGVDMVEAELEIGRKEISFLAGAFDAPPSDSQEVRFPAPYADARYLRMVYVTQTKTVASDGRGRDVRGRRDIDAAFHGQTAIYGPYFNEEKEYVICYSAPVKQDNRIVGVLSVEKDGYRFCELIENIRFMHSGESYIINADGTDIAVSDKNHMDWVTTQYNGRKLYEEQADAETKSIIELEQKGLDGETGVGTYYWEDGLVYVFYEPIPSVGWVLLAGLREEEIAAMTQSVFFASISKGPTLVFCLLLVLLLTALIIYWIISSMKKNAEVNERLEIIASYDALTGLLNRNSYHASLDMLSKEERRSFACIYIDVNGLHEINNHLGHKAGDKMLKAVADALRGTFAQSDLYRIGGDEFVVLCWGQSEQEVYHLAEQVRQTLRTQNYEISIGIAWRERDYNIENIINDAEAEMQQDKRLFYRNHGNERRIRTMDKQLEQMILEKQDADTFLEVLAPEFKGVYFVNLNSDSIRHLYIPTYFEAFLKEAGDRFSKAMLLYARKVVKPEYYHLFHDLCNYDKLEKQLNNNHMPEFIYQKTDGDWLKMRVLKFRAYTDEQQETLWIFTNTDNPKAG